MRLKKRWACGLLLPPPPVGKKMGGWGGAPNAIFSAAHAVAGNPQPQTRGTAENLDLSRPLWWGRCTFLTTGRGLVYPAKSNKGLFPLAFPP